MKHTIYFLIFMTVNNILFSSEIKSISKKFELEYVPWNGQIVSIRQLLCLTFNSERIVGFLSSGIIFKIDENNVEIKHAISRACLSSSQQTHIKINNNSELTQQNDLFIAITAANILKVKNLLDQGSNPFLLKGSNLDLFEMKNVLDRTRRQDRDEYLKLLEKAENKFCLSIFTFLHQRKNNKDLKEMVNTILEFCS